MDPRLQRLFTSLGATFEAEIARDEEEAAEDLAFSLRQGRSLADVLERGSWHLMTPAGRRPVSFLGADYAVADPAIVVPLGSAVFAASDEPSQVDVSDGTLLQFLRSLARSGALVEVTSHAGVFGGRLLWTGTDHVVVDTGAGRIAIALGGLEMVVVREGRGDGR